MRLIIHGSHGTLAFTDASDLPKTLEQIPMWTLLLKVLLPESQVQCIYFQIGTPDSQVKFGQKGCIAKTVVEKGACIRGPIRGLYQVNTNGVTSGLVCPGASLPWTSEARLLHWSWHYWFFPPKELWRGRLFGKSSQHLLNRHTFHDLLYLHFFHSFALLLFIYHVCPSFCIHVLSMFLASCIHVLSSTCVSFHFHDPRSGMFSPMTVKRILNSEGTAFTWMLSTREQLYFIPPVPTTNISRPLKTSLPWVLPCTLPCLVQPRLHLFLRYEDFCWCTCYCTCWCTRGLQYALKVFP